MNTFKGANPSKVCHRFIGCKNYWQLHQDDLHCLNLEQNTSSSVLLTGFRTSCLLLHPVVSDKADSLLLHLGYLEFWSYLKDFPRKLTTTYVRRVLHFGTFLHVKININYAYRLIRLRPRAWSRFVAKVRAFVVGISNFRLWGTGIFTYRG